MKAINKTDKKTMEQAKKNLSNIFSSVPLDSFRYNIKFKAIRNFTNIDNHKKYLKNKIYDKEVNIEELISLKNAHKNKDYAEKQPYKIISIMERSK